MAKHTLKATGIAWYRREHYARLRKLFVDGRKLPDTFDKWLKKSRRSYDQKLAEGVFVEKVTIEPEAFFEWCQAHGQSTDAAARFSYVNDVLTKQFSHKATVSMAE